MKKIRKLISLILSVVIISAGICMPVNAADSNGDAVEALSKDGVVLRMGLLGDSHVSASGQHKEYFKKAITTLNTIGGIDVLALTGDVVLNSSIVEETHYDIIKGIMTENGIENADGKIPYIYAMGNHEFIQNDNDPETCAQAVSVFTEKMGQELDYHGVYNGYHVIASGGESYSCQWSSGNYNTDEAWIMSEIEAIEAAEDYDPDKPIFLILHHPIVGSTFTGISTIDRRYTTAFVDFLKARPNIINLTAHKHMAMQYPQVIGQDLGFTAFQTPLTSTAANSIMHQGAFLDITTDNKVKIYKYDLTTMTYIGEPWVIDIPAGKEGFRYTSEKRALNTQAPVYPEGAEITFSDIENYSVTLNYPTGTIEAMNGQNDGVVRQHRIIVTDKETGEEMVNADKSADFIIVPQPTTCSYEVKDLDPGTTYTVSIEPESMFGVYGEALIGEFTTAGDKTSVMLDDTISLTTSKSLVGDIIPSTDAEGNETSKNSYDSYSSGYNAVLIRQGDWFTYTINVGEGEKITTPGLYRVTYNYGSKRAATFTVSYNNNDSAYTEVGSVELPLTGDYGMFKSYYDDEYIMLKSGENKLKIYASGIGGNDGVYFRAPALNRVISGANVDYVIGTSIYNPITATNGTGIGAFTSNISTSTYQKSTMLTFRKGNYVVLPIMVPYTAAYQIELTAKSTSVKSGTNVFKAAFSTESLETAAGLSTYSCAMTGTTWTTSWDTYNLSSSYVLEGGVQYYMKVCATSVAGKHISQLSNIRFVDNGEYASGAEFTSLSVDGCDLSPAFSNDVTEYTVYAPAGKALNVSAVTSVDGAKVTVDDTVISYGINETPVKVKVTSINGKNSKTYNLNVIGTETHASLNASGQMYVNGSETGIDIEKLLNGTGVISLNGSGDNGFGVHYTETAVVEIDLGKPYELYKFTWEKTNQGGVVANMQILGSNDPTFAEGTYEVLGTTDGTSTAGTKTSDHRISTTALTSSKAYRYVKLVKLSGTSQTFYPCKMDLYGLPVINAEIEGLSATVTVPSRYYALCDSVIAVVYDHTGKLIDVKPISASTDGYTTSATVTKSDSADYVKVMIWKGLSDMIPRMETTTLE